MKSVNSSCSGSDKIKSICLSDWNSGSHDTQIHLCCDPSIIGVPKRWIQNATCLSTLNHFYLPTSPSWLCIPFHILPNNPSKRILLTHFSIHSLPRIPASCGQNSLKIHWLRNWKLHIIINITHGSRDVRKMSLFFIAVDIATVSATSRIGCYLLAEGGSRYPSVLLVKMNIWSCVPRS